MKKKTLTTILLLLLALLLIPKAFTLSGRQIMEKVKKESTPKSTHSAIQLIIVEKNGTRKTRLLEMWSEKDSRGLNRSLIIFRKPLSVKNTKFLIIQNKGRPDDQYIYLPALRRVRRIAASARNKSFMGTEFTYEDMSTRNINDDTYTILREETYDGYSCYVVQSIPKNKESYHYSKVINWVSKKMWMVVKAEMYDINGNLKKVLTMEDFKKIDGYWSPGKTIMKNVENGRSTILLNLKTEYDKKYPLSLFSVQYLKRGKLN